MALSGKLLEKRVGLRELLLEIKKSGACRGMSNEIFFPTVGKVGEVQRAEAKAVCAGCSVRSSCLEYAVRAGEDHGVWGGTSERERRSLRRVYLRNRKFQ